MKQLPWRLSSSLVLLSVTALVAQERTAAPDRPKLSQTAKSKKLQALPTHAPAPADNPATPDKVELGKRLFFDTRLSGDDKTSCATCHQPQKAYGDGLALSPGIGGKPLTRNTPTCLNTGFLDAFFWDGRAGSLEEQALGPIQSPVEMNQDLDELENELAAIPDYVNRFHRVFDARPNRRDIAKALAAFQRTLVTEPSPFDRFLAGDRNAISAEARQGFELFTGDAGCVRCHHGPVLTDGKFYRLGVGYRDEGRAQVTGNREDRFRFRTPSLRNVAETGPYMHDGSLKTLDAVVTFYYRGIPTTAHDGLMPDAEPLAGQSFSEIPQIVAFLKTLTGRAPAVKPPDLPGSEAKSASPADVQKEKDDRR